MPVPDPFREGLARGWKTYNGSQLTQHLAERLKAPESSNHLADLIFLTVDQWVLEA